MQLEAVVRRLELEQLYTDYAHCLDADELERWPDFFTDDCSVDPTAGGIHPRSSRVARLYAELVSFPGSRNRDKSHSLDGRTVAPIQRE